MTRTYIRFEPAWKKLASKNKRNGCAQHGSNDVMKKEAVCFGIRKTHLAVKIMWIL